MKKIAVIDDDPAQRKILELNLSGQNYEVLCFPSGAAFLNHTFTEPPFAIILDYHLKEAKTGFEYLDEILKKVPRVPVIYLTSQTDVEVIKKIENSKASGYISKDATSLVRLRMELDKQAAKPEGNWLSNLFNK